MHKVGRLRAYAILILAVLIRVTILGHFRIFGAEPDIVMIFVTFFGFFLGSGAGLEAGIVSGLMTDVYSLDYFGINMLVYSAAGLLAGALKSSFAGESRRTQGLAVFTCTVFSLCLRFMIVSSLSGAVSLRFGEYLGACMIPAGIYTALVSIPVFIKFADIYHLREQEDLL